MSTQDSGNSQPLFPSLCKNGCGFFSGIDSKGFCSVCYKKYLKKEAAEKSEAGEADDTTSAVLAQLSLEEAPAKVNPEEVEASLAEVAVAPVAEVKAEAIEEDQPSSSSTTDGATAAVTIEKEEEPKETKKEEESMFFLQEEAGLNRFLLQMWRPVLRSSQIQR